MGTFPENLKICRKRSHMSQEVVAVNCKIASGTYRRYEKDLREPTASLMVKLADFYGVTLDQLTGRVPLPDQEA